MKQIRSFALPFFFFYTACGQNLAVKQVNSIEFQKLIRNEPGILLDVRTLGEYQNGHINNADQLNFYALDFKQKLLLLPRNQPIYLYCNTGYRSQRAAKILVDNGYKNVYNLEHGIMEWNLKNLPVIVEPDAKPDNENKMQPDEFNALINSEQLVFVDFYAPWCAPCKKMMPIIDSLKTEYQDKITIVKINVDASKKLTKELGIVSIPYFVLYYKGKAQYILNGIVDKQELENIFDKSMALISTKQAVKK